MSCQTTTARPDVRVDMRSTLPEAPGPGTGRVNGLLSGDARGVGGLAHERRRARREPSAGTRPLTR